MAVNGRIAIGVEAEPRRQEARCSGGVMLGYGMAVVVDSLFGIAVLYGTGKDRNGSAGVRLACLLRRKE